MVFVFDLDDTVCETDAYSEYYIKKFIKDNKLPYKQVASVVRFAEKKFDWDTETALKWYKTYGDQMMKEFPCKPDAIKVINALYDMGHTIVFATARANDWHTDPEGLTYEWLKNNGIKYSKIYIGRVDKEKICEDEHADIFIDDDIKITGRVAEHFADGKTKKCKSFLMTTNYNKPLEIANGVERVSGFADFAIRLKEFGININLQNKKSAR